MIDLGPDFPSSPQSLRLVVMDRYDGPARLEWWANRSTCLGSAEVRVTVTVDGEDWRATADLEPPLTTDEREGWSFLLELSPYFTLVFLDEPGAQLDVHVEEVDRGQLVLTAP
jgi:hypothetical protein